MQHAKSHGGRKLALLLTAAVLLSLALSLPGTHAANALNCRVGCDPIVGLAFYMDAAHTKLLCVVTCNVNTCHGKTSPYYVEFEVCCCN
jgi:hypothetical protein